MLRARVTLFKWIHLLNHAESHALVTTENVTKTRAVFEQFLSTFLSNLFSSEFFLKVRVKNQEN